MNLRAALCALLLGVIALGAFEFGQVTAARGATLAAAPARPTVAAAPDPQQAQPRGWLALLGFNSPAPAPASLAREDEDTLPDIAAIDSYEDLIYAQPARVDVAVAAIRASTPGKPGLFAVGFAGDAEENVFRNEVAFLPKLLAAHFDAAGRTLQLVNSPYTFDTLPLATRSNLDRALVGIGGRMDKANDILLLFLTSHGSHDHHLYVEMGSLPLDQPSPQDIRRALDRSGITWRIVVISACYSGGFIPALREPHTLVITAARADRPSFGCGSDAQLTWFGKAFLVQALNRTTDFRAAFDQARRSIATWEKAEHEQPSDPQIWVGPRIAAKLRTWREGLPVAPHPIAFEPTQRRRLARSTRH